MKTLILLSVLILSGCANTSAFEVVRNHYNSMDPCQSKDMPSYCGSNKDKVIRVTKGTGNSYIIKQQ